MQNQERDPDQLQKDVAYIIALGERFTHQGKLADAAARNKLVSQEGRDSEESKAADLP